MSKIKELNILKMADISSASTLNNNLSVVVNTREPPEDPAKPIAEPSKNETIDESELRFYKLLSQTLSNILKDNNMKLLINLIDQSGKIIIEAKTLIELIAIKTNVDPKLVNISVIEDDDNTGCFAKVSPIKLIRNIKIDDETFNLKYNREYNILQDTYNISLTKTIIPDSII